MKTIGLIGGTTWHSTMVVVFQGFCRGGIGPRLEYIRCLLRLLMKNYLRNRIYNMKGVA